jgi:DNA primase
MNHEKMEFPEAVHAMADKAGVSIKETGGAPDDPRARQRDGILAALRASAFHYRSRLKAPAGAKASAYLESRGITEESVDRFLIGYSENQWEGLIKSVRGEFRDADLEAAGLTIRSKSGSFYDRFRDRLMFPVSDVRGKVLGFGGRVLPGAPDDAPKYVNTPETPVYRKSRILYGLHLAREEKLRDTGIVVVEGYTDVILLHQGGVRNAIATCGTALTPDHVQLLRRYTNKVALVFDGDEAGVAAMERGLDLLVGAEVDISVVILPEGEDPADFMVKRGAEKFREAVAGGRDLFEFKLSLLSEKEDMKTAGGAARAADEILKLIAKVCHPVRREKLMSRTSEVLGISVNVLSERFRQGGRPPPRAPVEVETEAAGPRSRYEAMVLEAILGDSRLIEQARDEMPVERFHDSNLREAASRVFEIHERDGRVALAQVIHSQPAGEFGTVCDLILQQEREGCFPDYALLYREGIEGLEGLTQLSRRNALLSALREAEASGDRDEKRRILEALQDLAGESSVGMTPH